MNKGKIFEREFAKSSKDDGFFTYRIKDTDLSFNGNSVSSFTNTNLCDYFIFDGENLFCIECKSTQYNSISIEIDLGKKENKMIKAHQIQGLIDASIYNGVFCGFVFNFRDETDLSKEETYYLSIECFNDFLVETHKKSINKADCRLRGIKCEQILKRKYYKYNIKKLLNDIKEKGVDRYET